MKRRALLTVCASLPFIPLVSAVTSREYSFKTVLPGTIESGLYSREVTCGIEAKQDKQRYEAQFSLQGMSENITIQARFTGRINQGVYRPEHVHIEQDISDTIAFYPYERHLTTDLHLSYHDQGVVVTINENNRNEGKLKTKIERFEPQGAIYDFGSLLLHTLMGLEYQGTVHFAGDGTFQTGQLNVTGAVNHRQTRLNGLKDILKGFSAEFQNNQLIKSQLDLSIVGFPITVTLSTEHATLEHSIEPSTR